MSAHPLPPSHKGHDQQRHKMLCQNNTSEPDGCSCVEQGNEGGGRERPQANNQKLVNLRPTKAHTATKTATRRYKQQTIQEHIHLSLSLVQRRLVNKKSQSTTSGWRLSPLDNCPSGLSLKTKQRDGLEGAGVPLGVPSLVTGKLHWGSLGAQPTSNHMEVNCSLQHNGVRSRDHFNLFTGMAQPLLPATTGSTARDLQFLTTKAVVREIAARRVAVLRQRRAGAGGAGART